MGLCGLWGYVINFGGGFLVEQNGMMYATAEPL